MKQFFLVFAASIVFGNSFSFATDLYEKNNVHNKSNSNQYGDFNKINSATMSDYGPHAKPNNYRNKRLNIFMKPFIYAYFLSEIETNKQVFIDRLIGPQPTFEAEEWVNVQHEIYSELANASKTVNQSPTYFYNIFKTWLNSSKGWSSFKNCFTVKTWKNNTFNIPKGYNQQKGQLYYRDYGCILQFDFLPNSKGNSWSVLNLPIIFPYTPRVTGLLQYYRDVTSTFGFYSFTYPVIKIVDPTLKPYEHKKTVQECLKTITETLIYNFNLTYSMITAKRVSIHQDQLSKELYTYGPPDDTKVYISFHFNNGASLYVRRIVEFYLSQSQ